MREELMRIYGKVLEERGYTREKWMIGNEEDVRINIIGKIGKQNKEITK